MAEAEEEEALGIRDDDEGNCRGAGEGDSRGKPDGTEGDNKGDKVNRGCQAS
jgi:hypothetical protein